MNSVSDCVASFLCRMCTQLIKTFIVPNHNLITLFDIFFEHASYPCCCADETESESEDSGVFLEMDMVIEEE